MQEEQILAKVRDICVRYHAKELILFGSRAAGTAHERSDIDLAVAGTDRFDDLSEEIRDIPTLYSFDVVNLDSCGNDALAEEIRHHGRKIL